MVSAITGENSLAPLQVLATQQTSAPHSRSEGVSMSTTVRTLNDVRNVDKELFNKVLMGLAMEVCHKVSRQAENAKRRTREARRNG
jgi:hypothetical protein